MKRKEITTIKMEHNNDRSIRYDFTEGIPISTIMMKTEADTKYRIAYCYYFIPGDFYRIRVLSYNYESNNPSWNWVSCGVIVYYI